ncbi:MAG: GNAT family N-acetyltransferase [Myxococcales bacterium]|nr:GNAT family N-acetyltransferase [Myxococcales bacterium]
MPIRPATLDDVGAIRRLAVDTQMFTEQDAGFVDEMVPAAVDGSAPEDHWIVYEMADGRVDGAAYVAPQPFSDRLWNVFFIAVAPRCQGQGVGGALMRHIEQMLRERGPQVARVILVETSSTDQYARTREFYPKQGYVEEARIREYFGPGDDKVVFWKALQPS